MVLHFSISQTQLTPLHWAVREDHDQVCRLLIERGADVHAKDKVSGTFSHTGERELQQLIYICDHVKLEQDRTVYPVTSIAFRAHCLKHTHTHTHTHTILKAHL